MITHVSEELRPGEEKKEEKVKREIRHRLIKRGLITHSTNTPKNTEKIPKSGSYA